MLEWDGPQGFRLTRFQAAGGSGPAHPSALRGHSQVSSAHLAPGLLMPRSVKPRSPS